MTHHEDSDNLDNNDNAPANHIINEAIKQELESWDWFEDVLKNDDKALFHNMMSDLKDYYKSMGTKG
jgi:hypothetical protein